MSCLPLEMGSQQNQTPEYMKSVKQGRILLGKMILPLGGMRNSRHRVPIGRGRKLDLEKGDIAYNGASVSLH